MKLEVKDNCPLNGFKKCKQFKCGWFVHMIGSNPNDGKDVDEYACAIAWLPMLLVENSMQSMLSGAAIVSFRNEIVKAVRNYSKEVKNKKFPLKKHSY